MTDDQIAPTPLLLWQTLRAYIESACALFGLPSAIAQKIWLSRAEYALVVGFLRPLEALLRRLLFIDALALTPAIACVEHKTRIRRAMPANTGGHFNLEDSQSWRAHFNLGAAWDRRHSAGKQVRRKLPPLVNAVSAAPLALRLEALIRGYNNREPLAQRLANVLARKTALVRALLAAPRRCDAPCPGYHEVMQATHLARDALAHAPDST